MGCTQEAIDVFEATRKTCTSHGDSAGVTWYAPGKAANCGGVAVSGLEMGQNSQRLKWSHQEVDAKLKDIMITCYTNCRETGKTYVKDSAIPSLVAGANIAGFVKVAKAMLDQGDWWISGK
jgi:glutamate dehydrogenase (NADP+)